LTDRICSETSERLLYLDCDGVLADFDKGFVDLFGMDPREYEDVHGHDEFWRQLKDAEEFFFNLPPMEDADVLWDAVKHLNPIILTGCPEGGWAEVQKHRWIRKHFGRRVSMITCASRDKSLFCEPGDIIVDDWPRHMPKWEARGGLWVYHTSAEKTIAQLVKLGVLDGPAKALLRTRTAS
jgi:hypothetical protein